MTTYAFTIQLTDSTFIALENLLKEECQKIKEQTGIEAYNPVTGEAKHPFGVILQEMKRSVSTAVLNSTSSFVSRGEN